MIMPKIIYKACNATNYRACNSRTIKYIVTHYTANNGDTAQGNANHFASHKNLKASAHYFVDENEVYQSVRDNDIAWHCGADTTYKHADCRNANAIGIEICSYKNASGFYFEPAAVDNAALLTRYLMDKYNVPIGNVLRHYDVTGKNCPAPFVQDASQWSAFKTRLVEGVIELALEAWMKDGGQNAVKELEKKGLLLGADTWGKESELAKPVPAYLFWMMLNRMAEYKGGK